MDRIDEYLSNNADSFEDALCELLRIPSVSTDSRFQADVQAAAQWVSDRLQRAGVQTEIVATNGHPIILGRWQQAGPEAPTALVYGHYDVQPPDPLNEWTSPPFEPTKRDGNIIARGATDDKGQMLTHVFSVEAWMAVEGRLPVNILYVLEGEEEVGSVHLGPFLEARKDQLRCDCVVISDSSQFAPGQPAITYGLRGLSYYELTLQGPKQDLHSGVFGGAVTNPAVALTQLLSGLIDSQGRIQVPGFYDDVVELQESEQQDLNNLPFDEAAFAASIGVDQLTGEEGRSTLQRRWSRPSFDIHGLTSGYQNEGAKTVLPARASAKFSFRLVPRQDPTRIHTALESFLQDRLPSGVRMTLRHFDGSAPGVVVPRDSAYLAAAQKAIHAGFGTPPVFIREGGSIPVVNTFSEEFGVDTLLLGWGLNDDNTHSPNEKFCLADFHRGIKASAHLWQELAQLSKPRS